MCAEVQVKVEGVWSPVGIVGYSLANSRGKSLLHPSATSVPFWKPSEGVEATRQLFLAKYVKAQLKLRANGCFAQNLSAADFPCEE